MGVGTRKVDNPSTAIDPEIQKVVNLEIHL